MLNGMDHHQTVIRVTGNGAKIAVQFIQIINGITVFLHLGAYHLIHGLGHGRFCGLSLCRRRSRGFRLILWYGNLAALLRSLLT